MLAHTRTGTGEPLVLVHGISHRRQGWDPVLPLLEPHREVIALDLPGHGESDDLPADFAGDAGALADAVEGFVAELGLERPHVAGNSLGGLIALTLASRGVVSSATALSPAGFWATPGRVWARGVLAGASAILERMSPSTLEGLLERGVSRAALLGVIMAHPGNVAPAELAAQLQGLARPKASFHTMLGALESWAVPPVASVPVTVGWGSRDHLLVPYRQIARLRRALPGAPVYVLPGCGHVPMADDPALVADLLLAGSRSDRHGSGSVTVGRHEIHSDDSSAPPRRVVASPRMRRPGP